MPGQRLKPGETNQTKEATKSPEALLECFVANPRNPRRSSYRRIQELGDSMRRIGQLQAVVTISKDRWGHKWKEDLARPDFGMSVQMVTLIGSSRLTAAQLAELKFLSFTLRDDLMDHPDGPLVAAALENLEREGFSLMDKARLCVEIAAEIGPDATNEQISNKLNNVGQKWVSQHRNLLRLCQPIQDLIDSGDQRFSLRMVREISPIGKDMSKDERQAEQLKALASFGIIMGQVPDDEDTSDEGDIEGAGGQATGGTAQLQTEPDAGGEKAASIVVTPTKSDTAVSLPGQRPKSDPRPVSDKSLTAKLQAYLAVDGRKPEDVGIRLAEALATDEARVKALRAAAGSIGAQSLAVLVQQLTELSNASPSEPADA